VSVAAPLEDWRLPAEWEPHAATWIAWPHRRATFLGDFAAVTEFFAGFIRQLAACEPVRVVASGAVLDDARSHLDGVAGVECVDIPTDDSWMRDTGPVFLVPASPVAAPRPRAVCWNWNAWGGKYPPWDRDAEVSRRIAGRLGLEAIEPGLVLEGGAVETDGKGTLLVNPRCVVDDRRNPGVSRAGMERALRDRLAIERVLWVEGDLVGDDTDGHIDQLVRFVAPGRVVAARQPDRLDPNHAALAAMHEQLAAAVDARGRKLEVVPIDIPARFAFEGTQLPASHLNFYVLNGGVMVPVFGGPTDDRAVETLAACFPGRRIVPVDSRVVVRGRGALHCITRDEPAVSGAAPPG
jgi:agmatine deiminase